MNVPVADVAILDAVEALKFVADLCLVEERLVSEALARFVGTPVYDAAELRGEALCCADCLARTIGFLDARMDQTL